MSQLNSVLLPLLKVILLQVYSLSLNDNARPFSQLPSANTLRVLGASLSQNHFVSIFKINSEYDYFLPLSFLKCCFKLPYSLTSIAFWMCLISALASWLFLAQEPKYLLKIFLLIISLRVKTNIYQMVCKTLIHLYPCSLLYIFTGSLFFLVPISHEPPQGLALVIPSASNAFTYTSTWFPSLFSSPFQ